MTWIFPEYERRATQRIAPERQALEAFLNHHRDTLLKKCAGLTAQQLRTRSVEPSILSLHGLVRHLAEVERWWFRRNFAGMHDLEALYCPPSNLGGDLNDIDTGDPEADLAAYRAEIEACDAVARGRSLDDTFKYMLDNEEYDLRWIYLHLIEEYARHNGHADLIRERIDGAIGV